MNSYSSLADLHCDHAYDNGRSSKTVVDAPLRRLLTEHFRIYVRQYIGEGSIIRAFLAHLYSFMDAFLIFLCSSPDLVDRMQRNDTFSICAIRFERKLKSQVKICPPGMFDVKRSCLFSCLQYLQLQIISSCT